MRTSPVHPSAYTGLVAHLGMPKAVLDPGGMVIDSNADLDAYFGAPVDWLIGRSIDDFLPADVAARIRTRMGDALDTNLVARHDDELAGRPVQLTLCPCRVDDAGPTVLLLIHDVRPRPRAGDARARQLRHAQLWDQVSTTRDDEVRRLLARELHDHAGSSLAAMLLACGSIRRAASLADARHAVDQLEEDLTRILGDLARAARSLYPSSLQHLGLAGALERSIVGRARDELLDVDDRIELAGCRLSSTVELAVYRIAQEAVDNVIRHADARRVAIQVVCDGNAIDLEIRDDGRGFDAGHLAEARGLGEIRDRATVLGGAVSIDSVIGRGTTIEARIPLDGPCRRRA